MAGLSDSAEWERRFSLPAHLAAPMLERLEASLPSHVYGGRGLAVGVYTEYLLDAAQAAFTDVSYRLRQYGAPAPPRGLSVDAPAVFEIKAGGGTAPRTKVRWTVAASGLGAGPRLERSALRTAALFDVQAPFPALDERALGAALLAVPGALRRRFACGYRRRYFLAPTVRLTFDDAIAFIEQPCGLGGRTHAIEGARLEMKGPRADVEVLERDLGLLGFEAVGSKRALGLRLCPEPVRGDVFADAQEA